MSRRMWAVLFGGSLALAAIIMVACADKAEPEVAPEAPAKITTILDGPGTTPLKPDRSFLYAVNPDGSDLELLFEHSGGMSSAVSLGGAVVAVMTRDRSENILYLVDATTSVSQEIARSPAMRLGKWSPDGEVLALSLQLASERPALGLYSVVSGEIQTIDLPETEYASPFFTNFIGWAPGSEALYIGRPDEDAVSVYRVDVEEARLAKVVEVFDYAALALSPNASGLTLGVMEYDQKSTATYTIEMLGGDGLGRTELVNFSDETPLSGGHGLAWSPDGSQLAYGRLTGNGPSISQAFVLGPDGESVQITNGEDGINGALLWSPKQDALLIIRDICTSCDVSGKKVALARADGSGEVRLPGAESYGHADAAWAPDGERFAYSGDALYVANSDGGESNAIVEIEGASYVPIVWADDERIVFVRTSTVAPVTYVAEPDGSAIEQFSAGANLPMTGQAHDDWPWPDDGRFLELVWAPDSSRAALVLRSEEGLQLVIQDANAHRVIAEHPFIAEPTWSPDGLEIAYEAEGTLWVVDVDTGQRTGVLDDVQNAGIAWTKDGETILATKGESVVSVAADGASPSKEVLALSDPTYDAPQLSLSPDGQTIAIGNDAGLAIGAFSSGEIVRVTELSVHGMAWSPDGRSLAFGARDIRGTGAASGVYLASREGDNFVQLTEASGRIHEVQYWLSDGMIMFLSHAQFI